jgi:ABC-type nitrate/sulfonate/bicarbonate transport system substrate-binding protein
MIRRACTVVLSLMLASGALAQAPEPLRVKVFPGAQNVALWTGLARGTFVKHGVAVDLQFTQTSPELRDGLASGAVDVAHAAADNAIAMIEVAKHDVVFVMGGDSSMNELFVQPDVATLADMRGRTLTVDAPNTAYALQAMKILKGAGVTPDQYKVKVTGGTFQRGKAMLESKENAASTLNPPYSFEAATAGLKSMGRAIDLIGPYQGSSAFAMRAWVAKNEPLLERYVAGYVEALRWATDPANREATTALLAEKTQALARARREDLRGGRRSEVRRGDRREAGRRGTAQRARDPRGVHRPVGRRAAVAGQVPGARAVRARNRADQVIGSRHAMDTSDQATVKALRRLTVAVWALVLVVALPGCHVRGCLRTVAHVVVEWARQRPAEPIRDDLPLDHAARAIPRVLDRREDRRFERDRDREASEGWREAQVRDFRGSQAVAGHHVPLQSRRRILRVQPLSQAERELRRRAADVLRGQPPATPLFDVDLRGPAGRGGRHAGRAPASQDQRRGKVIASAPWLGIK